MKAMFLECGKIINTHGIDGKVKVEPYCDNPEVFASLPYVYFLEDKKYIKCKVKSASVFKNSVITRIDSITDVDKAEASVGKLLYAYRFDIAKNDNDYFISDLIGLPVIDIDNGREYGKLKDVINRGASDIYVVETHDGERMIPAVNEFIKKIDTETGIYVKPIEGMFD